AHSAAPHLANDAIGAQPLRRLLVIVVGGRHFMAYRVNCGSKNWKAFHVVGGQRFFAGRRAILPVKRHEMVQEFRAKRRSDAVQIRFENWPLPGSPRRLEIIADLLDLPNLAWRRRGES